MKKALWEITGIWKQCHFGKIDLQAWKLGFINMQERAWDAQG
jgi:hypothetical protein